MKFAISTQPRLAITAHDTLQRLSHAKPIAFNALWEPSDTVSITVKAIEKRRVLGDKDLQSIIKTRPRSYMTPSVSLDDIEDEDRRKLLINFTYETTANQAAKEVWDDFKSRSPCLRAKEPEKSLIDRQVISRLPARFQGAAKRWDSVQCRSFLADDTCYDEKDKIRKTKYIREIQSEIHADKERSEKKHAIRKLIGQDKLSTIYDKLPSYKGYRPFIALGVPLEKRESYQLSN